MGPLLLSGSTLYGVASGGGSAEEGTLFSIGTDGSNFTVLHTFTGGSGDGAAPEGSLIISGSTLYGVTSGGGNAGGTGTVFSVGTDGSAFTLLHSFSAGADGANPAYGLTLSGTTLYGTSFGGGARGNIFSVGTDGSDFTVLYSFGGGTDGAYPGQLTLSGSTLYGMTAWSTVVSYGDSGGTIFSIGTDGSSFTVLHNFTGGALDGQSGYNDGLVVSGSTLYGMTTEGGAANDGTVFSIGTDGSAFTLLHSFNGTDGVTAWGNLILSSGSLYGVTAGGGANSDGEIFTLATGGTGFGLVHSFGGDNTAATDGADPTGNFILVGDTFYGMAPEGGAANGGTVFSIKADGTGFSVLHSFTYGADGGSPYGSLTLVGSTLYGMTCCGGTGGYGTIFSIGMDGSNFTLLHTFMGGALDGAVPRAALILSGSTLYGITNQGGTAGQGTVFSIGVDGTGFTLLHSFTGVGLDGSYPGFSSLVLSSGTLYGVTEQGGTSSQGTIFSIGTDGTGFNVLYSFTGGTDGAAPNGSLILFGNTLYGTTVQGGTASDGTIFSIGTDGSNFDVLHTFTGGATDGANMYGDLILSGGIFYGMTYEGGSNNEGTIFSMAIDGSAFNLLYSFGATATDSFNPQGDLILSGNALYGMSSYGGSRSGGTIFGFGL